MTASRKDIADGVEELLRRRRARDRLIEFTTYTKPGYKVGRVHELIAAKLDGVERGEIKRLMLLVPPRHGKSELASLRFIAYALGRDPTRQIISVAATDDFAAAWGRDVRNLIASEEYTRLFPETQLASDSAAKGKWHTKQGGVYFATGVGGAIMGKGADIMPIDDPFSSMADAQSEATRRAVKEWFVGSARNRLQPGGRIVLINHRMHEDDLSGFLLAEELAGGEKWEVVELPAICDSEEDQLGRQIGEALDPDRWPIEELLQLKRSMVATPRFWSALYQQQPTPDDGEYFKREWFRLYDKAPPRATLKIYGASDYAVSEGKGDYTVHLVVGVDPNDNIYVLDMWRGQKASDVWIEKFIDLVERWEPAVWAEEAGQIRGSIGPFILKRMRERQVFCYRKAFSSPAGNDKSVRARAIQARAAMGMLYLPRSAVWAEDLITESLRFPAGKHDDQVDCLSLIGRMLGDMGKGKSLPKEAGRPKPKPGELTLDMLCKLESQRPSCVARI